MAISADVQHLYPGNKIRLITVDGSVYGADIMRFHYSAMPPDLTNLGAKDANGNYPNAQVKARDIVYQGLEYGLWPFELTGISATSDGTVPQPKLTVSNISNLISALCLDYEDCVKFRVTIVDTFVEYLDAANFPGGNPSANPDEYFKQSFYVDSKSSENKREVEFTLSSPFDLAGVQLPTRQITTLCTWACRGWYRTGKGCSYSGSRYFDENDNPVSDPSEDVCPGFVNSCKIRFGENEELDYGAFISAGLIK